MLELWLYFVRDFHPLLAGGSLYVFFDSWWVAQGLADLFPKHYTKTGYFLLNMFGLRCWSFLSFSTSVLFLWRDEKLFILPLILVLVVASSFSSLIFSGKPEFRFFNPTRWRFLIRLWFPGKSSTEDVDSESKNSPPLRLLQKWKI